MDNLKFTIRLGIIAAMAAAAALAGCQAPGKEAGPAETGGTATLRLALAPAALARSQGSAAAVDSLAIRITAEDMAPVDFSRSGDSLAVSLTGLVPGEGRLVQAWLFRAGRLLYSGQGTYSFRREARTDIALRCDALFSRVVSRFHLPAGLPAPVRGGRLRLSGSAGTYTAPLVVRDEFGSFLADELPGDAKYDVSMELSDSAGKVRYQAERSGVFLPLGEEARWDLSLLPTDAGASIGLGLGAPKEAVVRTAFPAARRSPTLSGQIVLSGFFAAPSEKDSGSQGEWFALFNRSADTLALSGCRLARDLGAGSTRSYPFDSALAIVPGATMTFGRSAAATDVHYSDFSLVNTSSSLLLLCAGDAVVVDSVRYGAAAGDSLLPMKEGWITRLGVGAVGRRASPAGWCLASPEAGRPGEWGECVE